MRCAPRTLLVSWAVCGVACGGGDNSDPRSAGGPRLEWDQRADSLQQAQSLTFRLYVDSVGRALTDARCGATTGATAYVCSSRLPVLGSGRHVLQLASVLDGVESVRSDALVVGNSAALTVVQQQQPQVPARPSEACIPGGVTECYEVREIVTGLSGVSALSPAPDGRLFFVESNSQVRVVMDGALVPEPVLTLEDDRARIVGLAVDEWSFHETRFVFVAWTEPSPSGQTQLNVTRYREIANTLGEGATILTGLAMPPDTSASIAVDRDGLVYVAVPATGDQGSSSRYQSGAVLRLTRDGLAPATNPLGLPSLAAGFAQPTSLSLDPDERRVWLAGRNPGGPYAIVVMPTPRSDAPQAARVITYVPSDEPVSLVMQKARQREARPSLFVIAQGRLSKASWSDDGRLANLAPLDLGEGMRLTTAAANASGGLYAACETSIVELVRQ